MEAPELVRGAGQGTLAARGDPIASRRPWWNPRLHWLVPLAVAAYFVTLLKGAWLSDDYFITLRQVEHLFAGNGIRFNLYERSFLTTSVAYFFLLLPLRLLTTDPFVIHALFALTCNALLLRVFWRLAGGNVGAWLFGVGLLFASKAHFDYSWFGQENPLGHVLAAGLVLAWLRLYPGLRGGHVPAPRQWQWFLALVALAPLYRHDFVLAWPLAAYALWDRRARLEGTGVVRALAWILAPLALWTLFSVVYFGFPLPASADSKLPEPFGLAQRLIAAWDYYRFSLHKDGVMMAVLFASQLLWWRRGPLRALACGVGLTLVYVVGVGADYMGGRFFTVAYVALVALACGTSHRWLRSFARRYGRATGRRTTGGFAVVLGCWILLWPHAPFAGPVVYDVPFLDRTTYVSGVANERAAWQPETGITVWWRSVRQGTTYPDDWTTRLGRLLREDGVADQSIHLCNLGLTPYMARLDQDFFDSYGLADRFMAQLPAVSWRPGHFHRARPEGLEESLASGVPRICGCWIEPLLCGLP